jgi:hypothetical protein
LPERERKLEEFISDCTLALESKDQAEVEDDFKQITKVIENCEISMQKNNQDLMDLNLQNRDFLDKIKGLKESQQTIFHEINEIQTEIEKISMKMMNLMENKENYIKKMGSLGSLPAEEHERFKSEHSETFNEIVRRKLKRYKKIPAC